MESDPIWRSNAVVRRALVAGRRYVEHRTPMADAALDSAPPKVDWRLALTGAVLLTVFFAIQQWAFGVANLALPGWFKGDYVLILSDGTKLRSSRTYRTVVQALIE